MATLPPHESDSSRIQFNSLIPLDNYWIGFKRITRFLAVNFGGRSRAGGGGAAAAAHRSGWRLGSGGRAT